MIDFMNIGDNISDELLAAYIDGNTTSEESSMIHNALGNDELLAEAIDIVNDSIPFGNGDWGNIFASHGKTKLMLSPIAELDNQLSFGIEGQTYEGDNLFDSLFDFGLAAVDSTDSVEDDYPANDDSDMMSGAETWENTDDISNMDNINY